MRDTQLQFEIDQLRKEKMIYALESIAVFIFSLFITVFLPQLLYKYFYANQQLMEEPKLLSYIPVVAFIIGVGYFAYAMIISFNKASKIRRLEKELVSSENNGRELKREHHDDLAEVKSLAEKTIKAKTTHRKTARKNRK